MKLLAADLEKVKLIHQYQDQQAALQQELLQYKYEVERVKRARDSLTMSGARVSEIPIHETSVGSQMESHHGSSVHSKGVPPVIDAHPIQQTTPGRRFQFMATDKAPGSVASQAKGASQGRPLKETDGTGNTYLLGQTLNKQLLQTTNKGSPSQASEGTIQHGIKIITENAPFSVYHPPDTSHTMAKELERGIPCSASSPTVGIKQAPNLPPIPSRITGTGMKNFQVGSQQNLAKGVSSQVNCPDMEIFREDRSFITDDEA